MKIKYIGQPSPCRIKAGIAVFKEWYKGDVKDVERFVAEKLLKNKNFVEVSGVVKEKKVKKKVVKEEESDSNFDLNGDGVFDKKDAHIAGEVLSEYKKVKKD